MRTYKHTHFFERTIKDHADDVQFSQLTKESINGVKSKNCFETLKHFSVVNGFPPDIMHDFLEGT